MISLIVAYDENRLIGHKGVLPWQIPEDMKHFRKMTTGCPMLMGRKTWESFGGALSNRDHYVLTNSFKGVVKKVAPRVFYVNGIQTAIDLMRYAHPDKTAWVIGGAEVYRKVLEEDWVDRIVATEIKGCYEGDTYFPKIGNEWTKICMQNNELFDINWYIKN